MSEDPMMADEVTRPLGPAMAHLEALAAEMATLPMSADVIVLTPPTFVALQRLCSRAAQELDVLAAQGTPYRPLAGLRSWTVQLDQTSRDPVVWAGRDGTREHRLAWTPEGGA